MKLLKNKTKDSYRRVPLIMGEGVTHYEYQTGVRFIPSIWFRDQVNTWEIGYLSAPWGELYEPLKIV